MSERVHDAVVGSVIGAFLGLLVGMSASPVVSIVVTSIAGLLSLFFGMSRTTEAGDKIKQYRMMGFAIGASLALLGGLYIRTHDLLSPTLSQQVASLRSAGFSEKESQHLALQIRYGIQPNGGLPEAKPRAVNSVFFNTSDDAKCFRVNRTDYSSIDEWQNALNQTTPEWRALVGSIHALPASTREAVISSAGALACGR